jgi:hypothetical protein
MSLSDCRATESLSRAKAEGTSKHRDAAHEDAIAGRIVRRNVSDYTRTVRDADFPVLVRTMSPHEFVIVHLAKGGHPNLSLVIDDSSSRVSVVVNLAKYSTGAKNSVQGAGGENDRRSHPTSISPGIHYAHPGFLGRREENSKLQVCPSKTVSLKGAVDETVNELCTNPAFSFLSEADSPDCSAVRPIVELGK